MSDNEPVENPKQKPKKHKRNRRDAIRERVAAASDGVNPVRQNPPVRFNIGGRPRKLDPDQATLDRNLKTILGAGAMNCTIEEVAALHDVAVETLEEFFVRYPDVKERFEAARLTGKASIRRNQFALSEKSPQMAIYLGEQELLQRDPYKMADLERKEREFEEYRRLEQAKLELRERDIAAREKALAMRIPADLGTGLPIDIQSLSLAQLMQLATRIKAAMAAGQSGGLTLQAVQQEKVG